MCAWVQLNLRTVGSFFDSSRLVRLAEDGLWSIVLHTRGVTVKLRHQPAPEYQHRYSPLESLSREKVIHGGGGMYSSFSSFPPTCGCVDFPLARVYAYECALVHRASQQRERRACIYTWLWAVCSDGAEEAAAAASPQAARTCRSVGNPASSDFRQRCFCECTCSARVRRSPPTPPRPTTRHRTFGSRVSSSGLEAMYVYTPLSRRTKKSSGARAPSHLLELAPLGLISPCALTSRGGLGGRQARLVRHDQPRSRTTLRQHLRPVFPSVYIMYIHTCNSEHF